MKTIIAGGRDYIPQRWQEQELNGLAKRIRISEVVQGGASGVDAWAKQWAAKVGIPCREFKADWNLGRKGGPLRNQEMARYADVCILFPGGRGTDSMRDMALKEGLEVYEIPNNGDDPVTWECVVRRDRFNI